jgi:hypothetical protein
VKENKGRLRKEAKERINIYKDRDVLGKSPKSLIPINRLSAELTKWIISGEYALNTII